MNARSKKGNGATTPKSSQRIPKNLYLSRAAVTMGEALMPVMRRRSLSDVVEQLIVDAHSGQKGAA